jgi:enoyl-CoA hydratase/carnithine racemase
MSDVLIRPHKEFLWLVLNRPPLNNLTVAMLEQLTAAMQQAQTNLPRLLVLTGTGEHAFCSGVDLPDESEQARLLRAAERTSKALEALRTQHVPTVALVKGQAIGPGCELAVLCETVIAHEHATFRLPAMNSSIFTDATSVYLPAIIGQEVTSKLMQNGQTLSAHEAMQLGLVHQVLTARRFLLDAEELLVMLSMTLSSSG